MGHIAALEMEIKQLSNGNAGNDERSSWDKLRNADANDPTVPGWAKGDNP